MGQAFDSGDHLIGSAFGETKREVFEKLQRQVPNAAKITIRTLEQGETPATSAEMEMPRYLCHKDVWALKIAGIQRDGEGENRETDGSAIITPADEGYAAFQVGAAYMRKHQPQVGGYYVVYKDGYQSFSPAAAFEDGYTRL